MRFIMRILGMVATGNVRGLATLVLGLALVGGLWETSLYNLSTRATATGVMTEVGVELINPVLVQNSLGVSQTVYAALQAQAKANPTQSLSIPGLKIKVMGRDIAGKSFTDASRVIYAQVADGYYDGGWTAVLAVPDTLLRAFGALAVLPQAVASQGAKQVGAPQLPNVPLPPLGAVGLSLQTFTAQGHAQVLAVDKWLIGIALACALLLALASPRWQRLTAPAWALISGAIPGALGIGVVAFFWARNAAAFKPYAGLLHLLAGAFVPVYVGSIGIGAAALVVAWIGDIITHTVGASQAVKARARAQAAAQAAYQAPAPMYRPPASAGGGAQGYGDWGYQERRPIGSAGVSGGNSGARAGYPRNVQGRPVSAPRSGPGSPNAPAWQGPAQGTGWQQPRPANPPYSDPNWGQASGAPPQPAAPRPAWSPPGEQRPPYTGPSWAREPGGSQWPAAPQDDQWSPERQGDEWSGAPQWGNPPAPPSRSPYDQPERQGGGWPGAGRPYGSPPAREQDRGRDDGAWESTPDDDPWTPRR